MHGLVGGWVGGGGGSSRDGRQRWLVETLALRWHSLIASQACNHATANKPPLRTIDKKTTTARKQAGASLHLEAHDDLVEQRRLAQHTPTGGGAAVAPHYTRKGGAGQHQGGVPLICPHLVHIHCGVQGQAGRAGFSSAHLAVTVAGGVAGQVRACTMCTCIPAVAPGLPAPPTYGALLQPLGQHHGVPLAGPFEHLKLLVHHLREIASATKGSDMQQRQASACMVRKWPEHCGTAGRQQAAQLGS